MLPDPLAVIETTLGPGVRGIELDGVHVVRAADRPDHAPGNAVHRTTALTAETVEAAIEDLDQRFPTGRARLVAPLERTVPTADGHVPSVLRVLRRDRPSARHDVRGDLQLDAPTDDRAWHGLTVLHRHAAAPGEDRARGNEDDRLRWWVDGVRTLVGEGRARVLRAARFGTPVAAGVLHWAPGIAVDDGHAGLAVVSDVVVHPAHRNLGIAHTLVEGLVAQHLADFPRAAVHGVWEQTGPEASATSPRGWTVHADMAVLTRHGDGADRARR